MATRWSSKDEEKINKFENAVFITIVTCILHIYKKLQMSEYYIFHIYTFSFFLSQPIKSEVFKSKDQ